MFMNEHTHRREHTHLRAQTRISHCVYVCVNIRTLTNVPNYSKNVYFVYARVSALVFKYVGVSFALRRNILNRKSLSNSKMMKEVAGTTHVTV